MHTCGNWSQIRDIDDDQQAVRFASLGHWELDAYTVIIRTQISTGNLMNIELNVCANLCFGIDPKRTILKADLYRRDRLLILSREIDPLHLEIEHLGSTFFSVFKAPVLSR